MVTLHVVALAINLIRVIEAFFGYQRFDCVTRMLFDLSFLSVDTVILSKGYCIVPRIHVLVFRSV